MHDPNEMSLEALWAHLTLGGQVRRLLQLARDEDLGPPTGTLDITSRVMVPEQAVVDADVVVRAPAGGVVAGLRCVPMLVEVFGATRHVSAEVRAEDGREVARGEVVCRLHGRARDVLAIERTLLNLVSRMSGIATRTRGFARLIEGTRAGVYDTRKTTPGLRALEKYAVRCGGGRTHRLGLYDAVLIKDNHLAGVEIARVAELVRAAAARARELAAEHGQRLMFVECEVDSLEQLGAIVGAGGAGLDIVLLDNMDAAALRRAVEMRDRAGVKLELEASGGVNEGTIRGIAETGVDRISVGGLTHQAVSLDLALDFR